MCFKESQIHKCSQSNAVDETKVEKTFKITSSSSSFQIRLLIGEANLLLLLLTFFFFFFFVSSTVTVSEAVRFEAAFRGGCRREKDGEDGDVSSESSPPPGEEKSSCIGVAIVDCLVIYLTIVA